MREAGKLGLTGNIVRPGYITGDPDTGIGPTDDFLLRMLAGSIQLSCAPDLSPSTINMVPVSHCARIVVASSLHPPVAGGVRVVQVTPHPQLSFNTFLGTLSTYGYDVPIVPYAQWKSALERYVLPTNRSGKEGGEREPHALLPLFDWVTGDLPSETKSRSLSDTNAGAVLRADGAGDDRSVSSKVTEETIAVYLAFMVAIKFIPAPTESEGRPLPRVNISEKQKKILGSGGVGRGVGK